MNLCSALKAVSLKVNTAYMVPPISQFTAGDSAAAGQYSGLSAPGLAQAVEAALAWWRDAGVDADFADTPRDWLAVTRPSPPPKARAVEKAPPAVAVAIAGGRDAWPTDLAGFAAWWMTEPALAANGALRVPPAGPEAPAMMIVVPMPEAQDSESLLSGPAGRLLDGFLAAAGLSRAEVYCAAALPARVAAPDWAALAEQGLGDLLAHHIALVRPQRAILFGQNGISTLLRNDSPNNPTRLPPFNHNGATVPALSVYDLEAIVARPALKAGLWNRWLDWDTGIIE
ncbi:uracil-DNA glycosylase family protein [Novosphingobium sp. Fuku2-ISO-50]|uniref:uracil-DNA glycosylase family protein n=1 Tax=Novosphingobium sp. Fuku2-ISO-50 TaxID=1739114 RepID=UPI000A7E811C|nr:uracil-DNA glycosylase family protein [Novosphingobium sp. Fuku2-ISO-50]